MRSTVVAAIKDETSYVWYKMRKTIRGIELRGKDIDIPKDSVIGLRSSTNGKSTRMVFRDKISVVYSPTTEQAERILKSAEPLLGGVAREKIGVVKPIRKGVKERRIEEELTTMLTLLKKKAPQFENIRIKDKRIYFDFEGGRTYSIYSIE